MRGWDFSSLDGRLDADETPWDFDGDCAQAMAAATRVLDLGTGGGERLIALLGRLPDGARPEVVAAEGWEPNIPVARAALEPRGVRVIVCDPEAGDRIAADDTSFDLVMCRHEALDAAEIARVLTPGGRLLLQQVDALDAAELREWFGGESAYPHVRLAVERAALESAGLAVELAEEWTGEMRFADSEVLVEYMGYVPWDVPGFEVEPHADALAALDAQRPIVVSQRRFRLTARKPEASGSERRERAALADD